MFNLFKKQECYYCKRTFKQSKLINYAGYYLCSKDCMCAFFGSITTEELLNLEKKDRQINTSIRR